MLRGLYEFRPINEKTLGFQMNDHLLFLEPHARDKNWLRVADANGHIGFVPINFIEIHRETSGEKLLGFLEESIRQARRDRLHTIDILGSVRQNILSSSYTPEEHMSHIERQVCELRARAISELNYEDDYSKRYPKSKEKHSSPVRLRSSGGSRSHGQHNYALHSHHYYGPPQQMHCHLDNSTTLIPPQFIGEILTSNPEAEPSGSPFVILPGAEPLTKPISSGGGGSGAVVGGSGSGGRKEKCRSKKHKKLAPAQPQLDLEGSGVTQYAEIQVLPPPPSHDTYSQPKLIAEYVKTSQQLQEEVQAQLYCTQPMPHLPFSTTPGGLESDEVIDCGGSPPTMEQRRKSSTSLGNRKLSIDGTGLDVVIMAAELVDIVRNATGLSHKLSQDATEVVLQYVCENIDGMPEDVGRLLMQLERPRAVSQSVEVITRSPDVFNIRKIFNRLTQCKEDEQQRSWALYEDEAMILDNLQRLHTILSKADASICIHAMEGDKYNSVNALVLYYQMETRWTIREKLVDCFSLMASIDPQASSVLINSILPMELAREIRECQGNVERISMCAGLLVMLLSSGENMPITHYDQLGSEFLCFVLSVVENPPNGEEKLTDTFMNLLFAYNLHFPFAEDNPILVTLEQQSNASVFTQKVIYFLNREVDPLESLLSAELERDLPNSVLKLTTDVFHSRKAADLFYTNDTKVLIDIVTRCLTDLSPGDTRRTSYLRLMGVIIRNCGYSEHKHRLEDVTNCFMSILCEEDPLAQQDQQLIRQVAAEFPQFFSLNLHR